MTECATPAVFVDGKPSTENDTASAGLTTMLPCVPVMEAVAVSLAVSDCTPAVSSVTVKAPVPPNRVESPGSTAWPSELVKWTVPL